MARSLHSKPTFGQKGHEDQYSRRSEPQTSGMKTDFDGLFAMLMPEERTLRGGGSGGSHKMGISWDPTFMQEKRAS